MKCTDCIHHNVCYDVEDYVEHYCENFTDKNKIIELPIKASSELKEELEKYCYERCVDEL